MARRSAAAASARIAAGASPRSSASSCAISQVVKKTGRKVPFDRDKLMRSVQIALRKRPVDPERVERAVSGIVRQLESSGETEIPTDEIGLLVMEALKALDDVAYVRFASVYREFSRSRGFPEGHRAN